MIALLYHDVVSPGEAASSGFLGGDADRYKFDRDTFAQHLNAVAARHATVRFTFDDGGVSAIEHTADMLETHGWRGLFFITTDYIGTPRFLDADQIRELQRRGHEIGSHSCSHPARMSACTDQQLIDEWQRSCDVLGDILNERVHVASVPGGYYSRRVAEVAGQCGIKQLYTSEPVRRQGMVDECEVLGRFSVQQGDTPESAAALAAEDLLPRLRLQAFWNTKKAIKAVGGEHWIRWRRQWLRRGDR